MTDFTRPVRRPFEARVESDFANVPEGNSKTENGWVAVADIPDHVKSVDLLTDLRHDEEVLREHHPGFRITRIYDRTWSEILVARCENDKDWLIEV